MNAKSWLLGIAGIFGACTFALFLTGSAVQANWTGNEEKKAIDESIPLDGADKIEVDFAVGELKIVHGPDDVIEVEGNIIIKARNRKKVERMLEELALEVETGDTIEIGLASPGFAKKCSVELTVRVPKGVDLDVELNVGELKAEIEMPASAEFAVNVGEVSVNGRG